ncbi:MAG: hypothetical protein HY814_02295 [Candidatus Riflebacteria bacterium]|nr:hypothetical protein [Candidatus Riflebacteria bacterium]
MKGLLCGTLALLSAAAVAFAQTASTPQTIGPAGAAPSGYLPAAPSGPMQVLAPAAGDRKGAASSHAVETTRLQEEQRQLKRRQELNALRLTELEMGEAMTRTNEALQEARRANDRPRLQRLEQRLAALQMDSQTLQRLGSLLSGPEPPPASSAQRAAAAPMSESVDSLKHTLRMHKLQRDLEDARSRVSELEAELRELAANQPVQPGLLAPATPPPAPPFK